MDRVQAYLQQLDVNAELIQNIKADQLGDATPCTDYDVRALVNHYLGSLAAFAKTARGEAAPMPGGEDFTEGPEGLGPVAARLHDEAKRAWSKPGVAEKTFPLGDGMPGDMVLHIALAEAVIHGWDVARATGQSYSIPDDVAGPLLERFKKEFEAYGIGAERPKGSRFASEVVVSGDASPQDKLIAFTGRTP